MANQIFLPSYTFKELGLEQIRTRNIFYLDLHKCSALEASEIVKTRIDECRRYGIKELAIVHGTPESYEGSLAEVIDEQLYIAKGQGQIYDVKAAPTLMSATVSSVSKPSPQNQEMWFRRFTARYATQRNPLCEDPYFPLRDYVDLARFIDELCSSTGGAPGWVCGGWWDERNVLQAAKEIAATLPASQAVKFGKHLYQLTQEGREEFLVEWEKRR